MLVLITTIVSFVCSAAVSSPQEDWPPYWDHSAVVYAKVNDVILQMPNSYVIRIQPLATLTGKLDPAERNEITTIAEIGSKISSIKQPPKKDDLVIVVLRENQDERTFYIPNGSASFLPVLGKSGTRACLFTVTGFDDPKVTETIENLRKLRGKQREETEQKAAAEKKGK